MATTLTEKEKEYVGFKEERDLITDSKFLEYLQKVNETKDYINVGFLTNASIKPYWRIQDVDI